MPHNALHAAGLKSCTFISSHWQRREERSSLVQLVRESQSHTALGREKCLCLTEPHGGVALLKLPVYPVCVWTQSNVKPGKPRPPGSAVDTVFK
ncbi:unnamed protein product [Knipowitschia caucasica]